MSRATDALTGEELIARDGQLTVRVGGLAARLLLGR